MPVDQTEQQAEITLSRLMPRLEAQFATETAQWSVFKARLTRHFGHLFRALLPLYGGQFDFYYHMEELLAMSARMWAARPGPMKELDAEREGNPRWFQSQRMVGGVCYVDLFAGSLEGVRERIPYFKELGLTYLHLMPLFLAPEGNSDGGYAVSSYRHVDPRLGTVAQLSALAGDLRRNGISLVLDFVFNHTSDRHEWARKALAGDAEYADYYYIFPDRTMPDAYQRTLREIFPDQRPGSFTYVPEMDKWVWTTFNSFQWDLNYSNPVVFNRMAEEMLFLANMGAEVLRLDALAFVWKKLGTDCENLPEAHLLIQAFNAVCRVAAPALLFKSEAIVHPDEVVRYVGEHECQLSYNPLLMALLWESLATRDVTLLRLSMRERFKIGDCCAWVNYVRSHDDIGWTFDDTAAARLGINGFDHRRFLNSFYTGRFEGSFARGLPFQENPRTGDARVSGTTASLAGLEAALREGDAEEVELAMKRILLLYSVAMSIGGIPLIYLGDEIGTPNDYAYRDDQAHVDDSRWVHRPATDWAHMALRDDPRALEGRIYARMSHLIAVRKGCQALARNDMDVIDSANSHVLGYVRRHGGKRLLVLANFSEALQQVSANQVRLYGLGYNFTDLITGDAITLKEDLRLDSYRFVWLAAEDSETQGTQELV